MRFYTIPLFLLVLACNNPAPPQDKPQAGENDPCKLTQLRRQRKDDAFRDPASTPLPAGTDSFDGLKYFPCNATFVTGAKLIPAEVKSVIDIPDTKAGMRHYELAGELQFSIGEKPLKLKAYFANESHRELFIMFRDKTSGKESYGGGRYLETPYISTGNITLDFNLAYNPFCHYNHDFSCPVVPAENMLDIEIRAGEMKFE